MCLCFALGWVGLGLVMLGSSDTEGCAEAGEGEGGERKQADGRKGRECEREAARGRGSACPLSARSIERLIGGADGCLARCFSGHDGGAILFFLRVGAAAAGPLLEAALRSASTDDWWHAVAYTTTILESECLT